MVKCEVVAAAKHGILAEIETLVEATGAAPRSAGENWRTETDGNKDMALVQL
ncbi:hypothetical protein CHS0354_029286, partial [Potamilus streckersoni]